MYPFPPSFGPLANGKDNEVDQNIEVVHESQIQSDGRPLGKVMSTQSIQMIMCLTY